VRKIPLLGGSPTVIAIAPGTQGPWSIVTDGANVYWLSAGPGAVMKTPVGGGASVVLAGGAYAAAASGGQSPVIAVDSAYVYWFNPPNLMKVAK
jgi:hypothetical protein